MISKLSRLSTEMFLETWEMTCREAMVAISTVALTFMAMTAGTNVRTAAESFWRAVDD